MIAPSLSSGIGEQTNGRANMKVLRKNLSKTKPDTVMILIYAEKARVVSTEWDFSIWLCCTGKTLFVFAIRQNAQKDIDVSQKT